MRPSQLLAAVVALSSVSAAWPDVFDSTNALADVKHVLYGRQDNSESAEPESTSAPRTTDAPRESDSDNSSGSARATPTASGDDDNKSTAKASGSGKGTKTTGKPKATNFGNDVPAGGIQMVTPSAIAGPQYYKVGDWVTFAWNYTSLSMTPSHVDILATCTQNQATYTIAVNQSVKETGQVLWNTSEYATPAEGKPVLLVATYTLLIYDSESSVSATAKPGYLAPYNQFTFGMYTPQPYVKWADFKCANCSGAGSIFDSSALRVLLITSATTIASLIYFTASFGLW